MEYERRPIREERSTAKGGAVAFALFTLLGVILVTCANLLAPDAAAATGIRLIGALIGVFGLTLLVLAWMSLRRTARELQELR